MIARLFRRVAGLGAGLLVAPFALALLSAYAVAVSARDDGHTTLPDHSSSASAAPINAFEVPAGFEPYIFRPTGERADPVNIIFLHTDAATASAAVERVLGWHPVSAASMNFRQKSGVEPTSRQLAIDVSSLVRYHMRIEAVPITDTQTYVLASVHRDDTAPCGHVGRAFDGMRDTVGTKFAEAGYPTRYVDLDNTNSGAHCDGSHVDGDGRAILIDLSRFPRVDPATRNRIPGVY